jgi:hypothetical protein
MNAIKRKKRDTEARAERLKAVAASFHAPYCTFHRAHLDGRLATIWIGGRLYVPRAEIERIEREGLPRKKAAKLRTGATAAVV